MPLALTAGPSAEPVTLAEAKAHCRVDGSDEDTLINALIVAARMHVEKSTGLALITQSWSLYLDRWPETQAVEIPLGPLQDVSAVRVYNAAGTAEVIPPAQYEVDLISPRGRVVRHEASPWPVPGRAVNGIEIAFTAGYGASASSVPQPLRHAVLLLVAHWYENREIIQSGQMTEMPVSVMALLAPYRTVKL